MQTKKLYIALTRQPQIKGVSHKLFVLNIMVVSILFITTKMFLLLALFLPLHYLARLINKKDPDIVNVYMKKIQKVPNVKNYAFWGRCNSYDPLVMEEFKE